MLLNATINQAGDLHDKWSDVRLGWLGMTQNTKN